jgi:hypothetical protein
MWDSADWRGVVFVACRPDAALRRRERCLTLAGIASTVLTERRPSGAYYKLCVREEQILDAHLALRLGGFCRSLRLERRRSGVLDAIEDWVRDFWEEALLRLARVLDLLGAIPPRLAAPDRSTPAA